MNKKTILHLIKSLDSGGCENMLLRTLPLTNSFDHILITLNKEGELAKQFKTKGFKVININQKSLFSFTSYSYLIKIITKYRPNIIITYLFHADIIGRLIIQTFTRYRTIPYLRTTYNYEKYRIVRFIEKLTKYFVKQYLANSEAVKNYYIEKIGVSKEKITVIPNGVDVSYYENIPKDGDLRKELGINPREIVIACVANLHINKGHKYLLEAFEDVYKEKKNLKLLLVGDGDNRENLKKQTKNYLSKNNILFLGKRSDVPQLLKIADIFILPTLFEGMSNAILEAMASGLPIITTNIPENRELLQNNKTGILISPKNSHKISQSINFLIDSPGLAKKLGETARIEVKQKFNIRKTAARLSYFLAKL